MPLLRISLANAHPQSELPVQLGMSEKKISAAVEPLHDGLIRFISTLVSETH
jgi:hypothetical protein